jgi:peptidoglycan hydrolase-like amidase
MVLKIPPPPTLSKDFQQLNRWLLEIQSILNNQGVIEPSNVDGLPALFTQVAALAAQVAILAADVATNTANIATNTANIATNTTEITANTANIATNTANIAALTARNQILNGAGAPGGGTGNNGDLYINNAGAPGSYLYGKIAGGWVAFA